MLPRLVVSTREIAWDDDLLGRTPAHAPLSWMRRDRALVGAGSPVVTLEASGAARSAQLAAQWRELVAAATIDDPVSLPGTGLVAFGAIAFDPESSCPSTLTVPAVIYGRRGDRAWQTTIACEGASAQTPTVEPWGAYWSATMGPGTLDPTAYQHAVRAGLDAIATGTLSKIVVARDLIGTAPATADLRRLVRELAAGYPDCWTYAVDGIIGASPETLVTVSGGTVTARVLAGTIARGPNADADNLAAVTLATSAKDQDEHGYAVRSVLAALAPHTTALAASEEPFTLKLPNVWHLATDVEGTLTGHASSLDLVDVLHPTAAVAGTPTADAIDAIRLIEGFDRGRYAGPVGWIDASGDGEWAIALRCVQVGEAVAGAQTRTLTAHAGAGVVTGSDPERELLETRVKFRPIVEALA